LASGVLGRYKVGCGGCRPEGFGLGFGFASAFRSVQHNSATHSRRRKKGGRKGYRMRRFSSFSGLVRELQQRLAKSQKSFKLVTSASRSSPGNSIVRVKQARIRGRGGTREA
jgi:hypothetical protein